MAAKMTAKMAAEAVAVLKAYADSVLADVEATTLGSVHAPYAEAERQHAALTARLQAARSAQAGHDAKAAAAAAALERTRADVLCAGGDADDGTRTERKAADAALGAKLNCERDCAQLERDIALTEKRLQAEKEAAQAAVRPKMRAVAVAFAQEHVELAEALHRFEQVAWAICDRTIELTGNPASGAGLSQAKMGRVSVFPQPEVAAEWVQRMEQEMKGVGYAA